ncbi:FAD:protein FMN transferase [Luteolibacter marinus]|uniref:FAD:protein FMN transferase n=1 Tax=Luteolibacter marinus TaxID=2776705 RepID=UPI0018692E96|nr:FAD:protein FMN transferase [Luteolibacter marinus]
MTRRFAIAGVAGTFFTLWQKRRRQQIVLTGRAMGCGWKFLTDEPVDQELTRREIASVIEHWEQVLSTWRPGSDLCRFNRGEAATGDLREVLALAESLYHDTQGAFDHRLLAKLTDAGFGPGGSGIDLSSLGKGYALDRVAERLATRGVRRYVISLAGEVRAGEGTWPVGIEAPVIGSGPVVETVDLSAASLATSGNVRQWNRRDGERLAGHILDPTTGTPVLRPPCSVSVIGPSAALASGWATALFVLGPAGTDLAGQHGLRVIWHGRPDGSPPDGPAGKIPPRQPANPVQD